MTNAGIPRWGLNLPAFDSEPTTILCNPDGLVSNAQSAQYSRCLKGQQLLAVSDGQGFVSMIDTADPLPCGVDFTDGQGNNLKAQWRAHELAITELHWIKVQLAQLSCVSGVSVHIHHSCNLLYAGGHADDYWIS